MPIASDRRQRRLTRIPVAAEYLDVSERTIQRWIADGKITGYRVGGKLVRVDLDQLDQLVRPIQTGHIA
ncbi:excisionase family DNA-binding protein [Rhodococcus sp. KRD162]|uniref:excisionase family DNA-binding protein n=1 Tax=Rhodococcus sp. KRD162 TaxID=2729725 RepID=UPI0019D1D194|nr:excisionase family DNA-binding protein [Rhodococcus sp. KRD162]